MATTMESLSETPPKLVLRVPWRDGNINYQPMHSKHFDSALGRVVELPTPRDRMITQQDEGRPHSWYVSYFCYRGQLG